jgi:squalene-hopene/tetraprenyl-beta-curcumene cyclase
MINRFAYRCAVVLVGLAVLVGGCSKDQPEPNAPPAADSGGSTPPPQAEQALADPQATTDAIDATHLAAAREMINDGVRFLLSARNDQGGWGFAPDRTHPAITAMALKTLVQHPSFDSSSEPVAKGFKLLLSFQQDDGGIYHPEMGQMNYTTAVAVMAMAAAQDPQMNDEMDQAVAFLRGLQIVPGSETPEADRIDQDHPFVGGVSYGKHGRPDLSNVGFWMQAMEEAGVPGDDPDIQRALLFVSNTQNLSETNPRPWAQVGVSDGGFIYAPAIKASVTTGESKAGAGPGGRGLRSYGSMTYTGFKSLLYAGVDRDDPRVRAAHDWIRTYWRLDSNPNMPQAQSQQGLYYYYHVFAKALRAWGQDVITDKDGEKHNWRHELIDALARRVSEDGSWSNPEERWGEANPVLSTSYSVLALQEALRR